jgi:cytidylate kinase
MNEIPVITVDGPSGAGKGTIANLLADKLDFHFLDSGALYRVTAYACQHDGIGLADETQVAEVARTLQVRFVSADNGEILVYYKDHDASRAIRTEAGGRGASTVGAMPLVRAALLQRQRDFQQAPGLVADGRDMGTVVFPEAALKFFLTASAEERAERRYQQLLQKGGSVDRAQVIKDIRERDERDSTRSASPLLPAADAIVIDSTATPIEQVFARVMTSVQERLEF